MKHDLATVLAEIRKGKPPSFVLLFGDDYQVHSACKAILDLLVPTERQIFNLERFDGGSVPWDQIEAALMTPPFFAGTKAVFIEDAPYFFSRESKGDLSEKVLQLWGEGKKDEAARLFFDLLILEGWTQEKWERLEEPFSDASVAELFGSDRKEAREEVLALAAFCRARGMDFGRRGKGEGHRLTELLEQGIPSGVVLLLAASHVDRRIRLYRSFQDKGIVLDLALKRDRSGRISPEVVREFLDQSLKEGGKKIEAQAREMILLRAGGELWGIRQELEKLFLYAGEEPWIRARDVEQVFVDQGEAWIFDLTRAIAERDSLRALGLLARLLSQGDHPLKLLGAIASEVRRLLAARCWIEGELRVQWKKGMTFAQFQTSVLRQGSPLLGQNPYGDYMTFQRAEGFTTSGLISYLERIYEADIQLKTTGTSHRLVMERLVLEMCQREGRITVQNEGKMQNADSKK